MSASHDSIRGPFVKHAFAKSVTKGEDFWLQQRGVEAGPAGAGVVLDLFGVFDGHGGKQAANFAAKQLAGNLTKRLSQQQAPGLGGEEDSGSACSADTTFDASGQAGDGQDSESSEASLDGIQQLLQDCPAVSEQGLEAWRAQDALAPALPEAMVAAFEQTQSDFFGHQKESGTTATLAAFNGWQLVVGNVGDSSAYLDTGSEVLQVSASHRLDTNKQEQARVKAVGCEVSATTLEGKAVGPLRVWPGGLAMSRTLGDWEAGDAVTASPEVRAVALPHTGARLVIASDGLWDSVQAKTAVHHVRSMVANKAAHELVQLALKSKTKCRDDITVIVVDAVRGPEDRMPCLMQKTGSGHMQAETQPAAPLLVHRPLDMPQAGHHLQQSIWEGRKAAVEWSEGVSISGGDPVPEATEDLMFSMSYGTTSSLADDEQMAGALQKQFTDESQLVQAAVEASEQEAASWTAIPMKLKRQAPIASPASAGEPSPRTEPEPMASDCPKEVQQPQQQQQQDSQIRHQGQLRPKQDRKPHPGRQLHAPRQGENSTQQQFRAAEGLEGRPLQQGPDLGRRPYQARRQHGIPARHAPQQQMQGRPHSFQLAQHVPYAQGSNQPPGQPAMYAGPPGQGATTPMPIMFGTLDPAMHAPSAAAPPAEDGMASTISGPPRRFFRGDTRQRRGGQRHHAPQREAGPAAAAGPELNQAAQIDGGFHTSRAPRGRAGRGGGRGPPRRRPPQQPQPAGV